MTHFTPLSAYSFNIFQQNSVQECMTIMCIIVTEEDLFKKYAKKVPFFCPFSNLPQKCCPAAVQGTFKNDSKYHICPYNYNTRPGFRVHKKIWGSRTLSSALSHIHSFVLPSQVDPHHNCLYACTMSNSLKLTLTCRSFIIIFSCRILIFNVNPWSILTHIKLML